MARNKPSLIRSIDIMLNETPLNQISYLILAGGRGQRMHGADKGLIQWQHKPMIEHIIQHIDAAPEKTIISANRNIEIYQKYTAHVISDKIPNALQSTIDDYEGSDETSTESSDGTSQEIFLGPLAGILSAMHICTTPYLLCLPCDSPDPPENLLNQLWQCMQSQNKNVALCHDGERLQPLFGLLSCQHKPFLQTFLQQGRRKVHDFFALIDPAICDFSAQKNRFNNFNSPDDMHE